MISRRGILKGLLGALIVYQIKPWLPSLPEELVPLTKKTLDAAIALLEPSAGYILDKNDWYLATEVYWGQK